MSNENLRKFNARITRLERAHVAGLGFEAQGTLGRSHYAPRRGIQFPLMGPMLVIVSLVCVFKALAHVQLGAELYQARVDAMWGGPGLEWLGALLMQPDPVTLWMSSHIAGLV